VTDTTIKRVQPVTFVSCRKNEPTKKTPYRKPTAEEDKRLAKLEAIAGKLRLLAKGRNHKLHTSLREE